jgi:hypothetical protein
MDAVALGHYEGMTITITVTLHYIQIVITIGGWSAARELIAEKYEKGGYPELVDFIRA